MFLVQKDLPEFEIVDGYYAKVVHTENMTITHVRVLADKPLPAHKHPHEQVTNILSGQLEMTVGGVTKICNPGDVVVIPSNVLHSARSITDCQVIDVFQPVREDFKDKT